MKRLLYVLCCCLVLVTAVAACGGNNNAEPPADQNGNNDADGNGADTGGGATNAEAEALYQANCLSCHGADLAGGMGPALNEIGASRSADEIRDSIANGIEGTSMPAFAGRLSDSEIDVLTNWLANQK